jgi:hypothetical protein
LHGCEVRCPAKHWVRRLQDLGHNCQLHEMRNGLRQKANVGLELSDAPVSTNRRLEDSVGNAS